ncbi:uncharacterized protein [Euphorbia lathyris]|uniref:uncharacterized protein n=1 Tax=Euphorbia lathyris TaxID=212925 RepID=UPI00331350F1
MERKSSSNSHMVKISMAKSPVPRSPMPKSPMPRSPMPKSPMPKSPMAYEKYKSRCAYGLISFFRFRHRQSKKMISDTYNRSLSIHSLDDQPRNSNQYIRDAVDEMTVTVDSSKVKPKKIKKDVCIEQKMMKKITTAKVENVHSDSGHVHDLSSKSRKATTTSRRHRRLPIYGCYDITTVQHQHANPTGVKIVAERSIDSLDSPAKVEVHPESNCERDCNSKSNEINLQVNLNEATEAFINQKLIEGRHISNDGSSHESKHFLDALDVLNSNKDLFIKLLQDPNSLLVKHIEDLRDSQENEQRKKLPTEFELLEHQIKESSFSKDGDFQPLENIVILKPHQNSLQHCTDKSSPNSPIFPFEQMKRKLMQAIRVGRKKKQLLLTDSAMHLESTNRVGGQEQCAKENVEDIISRDSTEKAAFDLGELSASSMDAKRNTQMDNAKESDPGVRDEAGLHSERDLESSCLSPNGPPKTKKHELFVEPRIDVSELKNGNTNLRRKRREKTWNETCSVPDYDYLPMISPGWTKENGVVSPRTRFSTYDTLQIASENHSRNQKGMKGSCSSLRQNVEASPSAVYRKQYEKRADVRDNLYVDVRERETNTNEISEQISPSGMTSKSDSYHDNGVNQSNETVDACEESEPLASPTSLETQTSNISLDDYSSSPLNRQNFNEFGMTKDHTEQPSPVSVLDQFFTEDVNSPIKTKCKPTLHVWELQIGIDEVFLAARHQLAVATKTNSITSTEEYRSMLSYITRVLQASCFTWDELSRKCQISDRLLDISLFEDIHMGPAQHCHDLRLIFDYVNEIVLDANSGYSRCSPWLSFIKPRIVPATENIVKQILKYVDWELLLAQRPETVENIIEMDLNKSGIWMDIRLDIEDAVSEIIDHLLEELIMEITIE